MKLAGSTSRRNRDRRAAVATFLRRSVVGCDFEFLDVVRVDAIKIANRVGHRRLVRFDPIDGHVVGAVARTIHMNARTGGPC